MTAVTETITVSPRKTGKGNSKDLRNDRLVPAVIYGPKMENQNVTLEEIFVVKHSGSKHESSIFQTKSEDGKLSSLKVMLKKIEKHPRSGRPVHVDLYALDMTATIKVNVPVNLVGEAKGVKEEGGVLQVTLRDLEIESNPTEIPEQIDVDVTELAVGSSIHVSDVKVPAGVKVITAAERTIVTCNLPKEEKAEEPVEVAAESGDATAEAAAPAAEDKK